MRVWFRCLRSAEDELVFASDAEGGSKSRREQQKGVGESASVHSVACQWRAASSAVDQRRENCRC